MPMTTSTIDGLSKAKFVVVTSDAVPDTTRAGHTLPNPPKEALPGSFQAPRSCRSGFRRVEISEPCNLRASELTGEGKQKRTNLRVQLYLRGSSAEEAQCIVCVAYAGALRAGQPNWRRLKSELF